MMLVYVCNISATFANESKYEFSLDFALSLLEFIISITRVKKFTDCTFYFASHILLAIFFLSHCSIIVVN